MVVYTYDNNGNQLSKTSTTYIAGIPQTPVVEQANTYDLFNQLISTVTSSGVTVINTYNGDGLRVGKSVNGSLTRYLYEYDKVVLEVNVFGDQTGNNVYGINLLTRQVGIDMFIYMYNGHADVTALLDTTGNVAATYYYDAFGNILDQTGTVNNNILYAGYQYDFETGLYYLNARMYDPVTARFMQEDTYTGEYNDPLSLNLYTYCHNEPLMYSDPTGHTELTSDGSYPAGMPSGIYNMLAEKKKAAESSGTGNNQTKPDWDSWKTRTNNMSISSESKQEIYDVLENRDALNALVVPCREKVIEMGTQNHEYLSTTTINFRAEKMAISQLLSQEYIDPDSVGPTLQGCIKAGASAVVGASAAVVEDSYRTLAFVPSLLEKAIVRTNSIDTLVEKGCTGLDNYFLSHSDIIDADAYNTGKVGGTAIFIVAGTYEAAKGIYALGKGVKQFFTSFSNPIKIPSPMNEIALLEGAEGVNANPLKLESNLDDFSAVNPVDDITNASRTETDIIEEASAGNAGKGFETFKDLKKTAGSPGENNQWHHIVEQSQINKSGFSPTQIQNMDNIIAVDKTIHGQISGYYSSKQAFTGGNTVRNWLAGQSYDLQFEFGMQKLIDLGVVK